MVRQALLILLAFCLAAPGMAMPLHCAPAIPAADQQGHPCHDDRGDEPDPSATTQMACIGCVASFGSPAFTVGEIGPAPNALTPAPPVSLTGRPRTPETPPPRA